MTKRYYYTDIAKAIMAHKQGIKLEVRHSDEQMSDYDIPENQRWSDWMYQSSLESGDVENVSDAISFIEDASSKIYIRQDSMHIFEPQIDDIGITGMGLPLYCSIGEGGYLCWYMGTEESALARVEIIQRNGQIFPWYDGVEDDAR